MLNSIRNVKFTKMRKLTMFITAVCVRECVFFNAVISFVCLSALIVRGVLAPT